MLAIESIHGPNQVLEISRIATPSCPLPIQSQNSIPLEKPLLITVLRSYIEQSRVSERVLLLFFAHWPRRTLHAFSFHFYSTGHVLRVQRKRKDIFRRLGYFLGVPWESLGRDSAKGGGDQTPNPRHWRGNQIHGLTFRKIYLLFPPPVASQAKHLERNSISCTPFPRGKKLACKASDAYLNPTGTLHSSKGLPTEIYRFTTSDAFSSAAGENMLCSKRVSYVSKILAIKISAMEPKLRGL